jgi:hypothetical protein
MKTFYFSKFPDFPASLSNMGVLAVFGHRLARPLQLLSANNDQSLTERFAAASARGMTSHSWSNGAGAMLCGRMAHMVVPLREIAKDW